MRRFDFKLVSCWFAVGMMAGCAMPLPHFDASLPKTADSPEPPGAPVVSRYAVEANQAATKAAGEGSSANVAKSADAASSPRDPGAKAASHASASHETNDADASTSRPAADSAAATSKAKASAEKIDLPPPRRPPPLAGSVAPAKSSANAKKSAAAENALVAILDSLPVAEKNGSANYDELTAQLESSDADLPPLLREQLLGLLNYSRQKASGERDAVVVTPSSAAAKSPVPTSPTSPVATSLPNNASTHQVPPPVIVAEPKTTTNQTTPHVTVNVTTTPNPAALPTDHAAANAAGKKAETDVRTDAASASTAPTLVTQPASVPATSVASTRNSPAKAVPEKQVAPPSEFDAADKSGVWRDNLRRAIESLESELRSDDLATPAQERARLATYLRILNVAADRREDALREIESLNKPQKEYWKKQLNALVVALDNEGMPVDSRRSALALRHLRDASNHLAADSTLDVRNLAFCSKVDGYGTYTEFPKYEFKPDQEVLLYVEVDNFVVEEKSVTRKLPSYETELHGSYQVLDGAGRRVADVDLPIDRQSCRNHRRDYFIAYRLYVPKRLEPGNYTLQLTIEDIKGRKTGQASIEFSVKP